MSLLNIGISGLNVSQTSLTVTGNNIANADQPSYSRQRTEVVTRPEQLTNGGYIGVGSIVEDITRVVDQFLLTQIRLDTGSFTNLDAMATNLEQLDSLLASDGSGLSEAISSFYSALESSAQDPTSEPARQVVMSQAEALVQRFNTVSSRIEQQNNSVNEQMDSLTRQVTTIAAGIAELNQAIEVQIGEGNGAKPNQLLDQREELLRKLAELVNVNTVADGNALNVFVGNGQPLVVGNTAATLEVVSSTREPGNVEINYVGANGTSQQITDYIRGGKIGGLLEFRDEVIPLALNSVGRIALGLADTLNQQNRLGLDLEGNLGDDIFTDINAGQAPAQRVIANSANTGAATVVANISDVSELTLDDYIINWTSATDYQIVRSTDNSVVAGTITGIPDTITIDGVDIDISAGSPAAGDVFYVRPTRTAATAMSMDMQRLQELAYAVPVTADADLGNVGTGQITQGEMLEIVDDAGTSFAPTNPIYSSVGVIDSEVLVRFTSATDYTVFVNADPTAPEALFSGTIIPGQSNSIFGQTPTDPNYIGFQVDISGRPQAGDEFTINYNANGSSDNRNALNLGATRTDDILDGSNTNFENAYGSLIEEIGTKTAQSQISRDAAESLLLQSQASRDSVSGVNLDEEAANLIKFEQAYNASAQIINVARQIFDTLLSSLG